MNIQLPPEIWRMILRHKRKQHFNELCLYIEPTIQIHLRDFYRKEILEELTLFFFINGQTEVFDYINYIMQQ